MKLAMMLLVAVAVATFGTADAKKKKDPKDCEVCEKVLTAIKKTFKKGEKKDMLKIEDRIEEFCKNKKLDRLEKKICYYIKPIKREVSRPFSVGMYPNEICKKKLKKQSADICAVKYRPKADKDTDYSKMRVKYLKQILTDRGVKCKGCVEKSDFVKKCKATAHMDL